MTHFTSYWAMLIFFSTVLKKSHERKLINILRSYLNWKKNNEKYKKNKNFIDFSISGFFSVFLYSFCHKKN